MKTLVLCALLGIACVVLARPGGRQGGGQLSGGFGGQQGGPGGQQGGPGGQQGGGQRSF